MLFDDWKDDPEEDEEDAFPSSAPHAAEPPAGLLPPRQSAECLGHGSAENGLAALAAADRLPHALIFAGPQGIGKATLAFRLARFLLKGERGGETLAVPPSDPVFTRVAAGGHPDLLYIERQFDDKKGRLRESVDVDEVRKVTPFLRLTASRQDGWRIVIVDDADTMNRNAQNAILKILEEPPPRALLVLIAHCPGSLIPTIRSRARTIALHPPEQSVFDTLLKRHDPSLTPSGLSLLHGITGGSIGRAVRLCGEEGGGGTDSVVRVLDLLKNWTAFDWVSIHRLADNLGKPGQEQGLSAFRDVLLWAVETMTRTLARGTPLPPVLDDASLRRLRDRLSLAGWNEICGALHAHFDTVQNASLDKRHAVTGAFTLIEDAAR